MMRIDKTVTSPSLAQSDALVKKLNRILQDMIFTYARLHPQDWEDHFPYAVCEYIAMVHTSIKVSQYRMLLVHEITLPLDLQI